MKKLILWFLFALLNTYIISVLTIPHTKPYNDQEKAANLQALHILSTSLTFRSSFSAIQKSTEPPLCPPSSATWHSNSTILQGSKPEAQLSLTKSSPSLPIVPSRPKQRTRSTPFGITKSAFSRRSLLPFFTAGTFLSQIKIGSCWKLTRHSSMRGWSFLPFSLWVSMVNGWLPGSSSPSL